MLDTFEHDPDWSHSDSSGDETTLVAAQLRDWISKGEYSAANPFPPPEDIADFFQLSVEDTWLVLMDLRDSGHLVLDRTGDYILPTPNALTRTSKKSEINADPQILKQKQRRKKTPTIPLYEQIYAILKERILNGHYDRIEFPTMSEAAAEYGVSRISTKAAYKLLQSESLIELSRGRRPIVLGTRIHQKIVSSVEGLVSGIEKLNLDSHVKITSHGICAAGIEVALALGCEPEHLVAKTERLTKVDGRKFSLVEVSVPEQFVSIFGNGAFDRPLSNKLLREYEISPSRINEEITACNATTEIAHALDVALGSAILKIRRTFHTRAHGPIICTIGYYRPDRFAYSSILRPGVSSPIG